MVYHSSTMVVPWYLTSNHGTYYIVLQILSWYHGTLHGTVDVTMVHSMVPQIYHGTYHGTYHSTSDITMVHTL